MRRSAPLVLCFLFACSGGEPPLCIADSFQCVGDQVERCVDEVWVVEATCGEGEACEIDAGVGACVDDVGSAADSD